MKSIEIYRASKENFQPNSSEYTEVLPEANRQDSEEILLVKPIEVKEEIS